MSYIFAKLFKIYFSSMSVKGLHLLALVKMKNMSCVVKYVVIIKPFFLLCCIMS